jgi:hypothetical protein
LPEFQNLRMNLVKEEPQGKKKIVWEKDLRIIIRHMDSNITTLVKNISASPENSEKSKNLNIVNKFKLFLTNN